MLNLLLHDLDCNVITLNEHWLFSSESLLYVPCGFTLASIFCRNPPLRNGGCSIYVKSTTNFTIVDVKKFCLNSIFEISAILLVKSNIVIATIYRTPNSDIECFFLTLRKLFGTYQRKIQIKYFNYNRRF